MNEWWRQAVCYQVYVRSFADADGDGTGDLRGLYDRLPYLSWLGVDAVWVTPFYPSPMADGGYDVADYRGVDPLFGTLDDVDAVLSRAHELGLRLMIDIVPNHTSDEHPWFRNAVSAPDHPDRAKYLFADPAPGGGPPNNWMSVFGGPAWTREPAGRQYYLHLFAPEQPDLNWRNPAVHDEFDAILHFWLDRGVDGFRIDVAHALYKDAAFRDNPERPGAGPRAIEFFRYEQRYTFDQPEVVGVYERWRSLVDGYGHAPALIGEVFLTEAERVARYVGRDRLHMAFNFTLLFTPWDAAKFREAIQSTIDAMGAGATWVLSNHDVVRHVTRYGGGETGRRRGRSAMLAILALPGTVFLYNGEELGLEEADVPLEARQDPIFKRTGGRIAGRDGARVPVPWSADPPGFGFTSGTPWLPIPQEWTERSVDRQRDKADSTLNFYRRAIAFRKGSAALCRGELRWLDAPDGWLAWERRLDDERIACLMNFADDSGELPLDATLVLGSDPQAELREGRLRLPGGSATWVRLPG